MDEKHKPDSLKFQWRILGAVLRSAWATSLDKSIAFEIVDNYRKDHRNSRASLSYLVNATGADRKSVIASTRRLVEHGPFSVARQGSGTRPTEYDIDFDFVQDKPSSGVDTTTRLNGSSSGVGTTTGGGVDTTTGSSSSGVDTTESVLPYAAYQADIRVERNDPASPSAPLADGLKATAAGNAGEGFEELWKAYGHRQKKADAKAAYLRAAPDVELHTRMVDAAKNWLSSWAAQGKDDAPRFTLAKWIEREEYECDPPTAFKGKDKASPKLTPRNANKPDIGIPISEKPDFAIQADQSACGTIERVEDWTDPDDGAKSLTVYYRTHRDEEIEHFFVYESDDAAEQDRGQKELRHLLEAVELNSVDHAEELVGRKVDLMINGGKFVSCSKPWTPAPKEPRPVPRFADIVKNTPMGGWYKMIGTASRDDNQEAA
jgi:hypothetical protein